MTYLGTQPNDVKKNTGLYTPSEILQLTKDGSWGGSLELIAEQSHSSDVASIDFTSIQENKYDVHYMSISKLTSGASSHQHRIQFYESGVLRTSNDYSYAFQYGSVTGSFGEVRATNQQLVIENTGSEGISQNVYIYFYNLGNSNKYSFATYQSFTDRTGTDLFIFGGGVMDNISTVDGIRILTSVGNFTDFDIKLYGVKQIWVT